MAGDYTDGGGWAKLDQTAVYELSAIASTFSPRFMEKQFRMLLTIYRSMDADGLISMGYRTLAERAGVTKQSAERFVHKLEESGDLEIVEEKKNKGGRYTIRRFPWRGGVSVNRDTPVSRERQKRDTSELLRSSQMGCVGTNVPTPPRYGTENNNSAPPMDNPPWRIRSDLTGGG